MFNINDLRQDYRLKSLDLSHLNPDPFLQFHLWFKEAQNAQVMEPNAFTLATASAEGRPSCRTVLLKGVDEKGFVFFTNYHSRKGKDISANPFGCMIFYWPELERQVVIDGAVEKISVDDSEAYFNTRPRGSQLSSWASHQDQVLNSRKELEKAYSRYEKEFEGKPVPKPPYWGGYRLIPDRLEFWQGRQNRLHDRFRYTLDKDAWQIDRLAP